ELNQIAHCHHLGSADHAVENAFLQCHSEGTQVKAVAREHAGSGGPLKVCRRRVAARLLHIDHVVVNQGGCVQHFHHRAHLDRHPAASAPESSAKEQERSAQTFSTVLLQVF